MERCPKCGCKEVKAYTPLTYYKCGSHDYDQRPGTFVQSEICKHNCNECACDKTIYRLNKEESKCK